MDSTCFDCLVSILGAPIAPPWPWQPWAPAWVHTQPVHCGPQLWQLCWWLPSLTEAVESRCLPWPPASRTTTTPGLASCPPCRVAAAFSSEWPMAQGTLLAGERGLRKSKYVVESSFRPWTQPWEKVRHQEALLPCMARPRVPFWMDLESTHLRPGPSPSTQKASILQSSMPSTGSLCPLGSSALRS